MEIFFTLNTPPLLTLSVYYEYASMHACKNCKHVDEKRVRKEINNHMLEGYYNFRHSLTDSHLLVNKYYYYYYSWLLW